MALRATYGDVPAAVDWIIRRREEKLEIRKQEQEDIRRRKLQKRLGVTESGQPVKYSNWAVLSHVIYAIFRQS
jgi:hypothetical protein